MSRLEKIIDYVQTKWYFNWPNLKIEGKYFLDAVLFPLGVCVMGRNALFIGDYGMGKTTTAEVLGSLIYGVPYDLMVASKITGHPQQTEEKMIGRPHLGELMKGNEMVVYSLFALAYPAVKIVDEISRLPPGIQEILIHSIDRGEFTYLNETINYKIIKINEVYFGKPPFIATTNYKDIGTKTIVEAILDRFDIAVEFLPPLCLEKIIYSQKNVREALQNSTLYEKSKKILLKSNLSITEKIIEFKKVRDEYRRYLESIGVPCLYDEEIVEIRERIKRIEIPDEVFLYIQVFKDKVNAIPTKVLKESPAQLRDDIPGIITVNLGPRTTESVCELSKFVAYVLRKGKVNVEIVRNVLPYAILHRVILRGGINEQKYYEILSSLHPEQYSLLEISRRIIEIYNYSFNKNRQLYEKIYSMIEEAKISDLVEFLKSYPGNDILVKSLRSRLVC